MTDLYLDVPLGVELHDLREDQVLGLLRGGDEPGRMVGLDFDQAGFDQPASLIIPTTAELVDAATRDAVALVRSLALTPGSLETYTTDEYERLALGERTDLVGAVGIAAAAPSVVMFRGRRACPCLAAWLPVYEQMLRHHGVIKSSIDIAQLIGGAAASGGTHATGGAFDIWQHTRLAVQIARWMGADASWARTRAQGFSPHCHGVLRGCTHNGPARYQITSTRYGVDHNKNGLANGARDDGPRPLSKRTWREGIEWAQAQMEDDMALSDADIEKIAKAVATKVWDADVIKIEAPVGTEESRKNNPFWSARAVMTNLLKNTWPGGGGGSGKA